MLVTEIGVATFPSVLEVCQVLCQSFMISSCNASDDPQGWALFSALYGQ